MDEMDYTTMEDNCLRHFWAKMQFLASCTFNYFNVKKSCVHIVTFIFYVLNFPR